MWNGVMVTLREAQRDERDRLATLLADYLFEFDGRTEPYPYLDAYWAEPERLPLLIESDGEVCGLCLIRRHDGGWRIAEFYVEPSRRRGGVGRAAVEALAARARSEGAAFLEAKVHPDNHGALQFWLSIDFSEIDPPETGVTVTRRSLVGHSS
jgi:ribosomal protein S18 acetylase RimI-like enzyme